MILGRGKEPGPAVNVLFDWGNHYHEQVVPIDFYTRRVSSQVFPSNPADSAQGAFGAISSL